MAQGIKCSICRSLGDLEGETSMCAFYMCEGVSSEFLCVTFGSMPWWSPSSDGSGLKWGL